MACYPFRIRYAWFTHAYLLVFLYSADADIPQSRSSQDLRSLERVETSAPSLPEASARKRIAFLRSEVARHDDLYFKQAKPEISDQAYDRLKQELRSLERSYPEIALSLISLPEIGDDRDGVFQTGLHGRPMLSLRKAYSQSALKRFHTRVAEASGSEAIAYLIEPKIDGIAISLYYEQGQLVRALTRGNGIEGDDITANILTIPSIPRELSRTAANGESIPIPDRIEVRGEFFSSFSDFEAINSQREARGESLFAHPRNLAAGSAKLRDPSQASQRRLSVLFFGYGTFLPRRIIPKTQQAFYEQARSWGLPVLKTVRIAEGFDALADAIKAQNADRSQLPFPTDGLVVKVNSLEQQRLLGSSDQAPRWALAYKFSPEQVETRLLAITIQVGRTGRLTPVAELDPVSISGSKISRATLQNRKTIVQKDLRIGDMVLVEKAGEIIPRIVSVNLSKRPTDSIAYAFPDRCPSCDSPIPLHTNAANLRCENANCPAQLQRRIEHFASSQCVAIEGLGPATIKALIAKGRIANLPDIYNLDQSKLHSPGENIRVSTKRLLQAIERSKRAELWRFIFGLGIPGIGKARAQALAAAFESLETLKEVTNADFEATDTPRASLDATTRKAILTYFSNPENQALISEFIRAGVRPSSRSTRTELTPKPFFGKSFVLTGKLPTLARQEAIALIEAAGGYIRDQVSSKTDYLLVGAKPGSKLEDAQTRKIAIIDEAAFRGMLANGSINR